MLTRSRNYSTHKRETNCSDCHYGLQVVWCISLSVCIAVYVVPSAPKLLFSYSLIFHSLIPSSSHTNIPDSSILSCLPFFNRLLYHRTAVVWCDPWAALHISYATHRQYLGVPESKTAQSILADSNSLTWHIQQSTSPWAEPGIADKLSSVWMHCLYSCNVRLFCCVNAVYELVALSVLTWKSLRRHTYWSSVVYFRSSAS